MNCTEFFFLNQVSRIIQKKKYPKNVIAITREQPIAQS